jgi:hypothetical protein
MLNLIPTPTPPPADQLAAALPELGRYSDLAGEAMMEALGDEYDPWADAQGGLQTAIHYIKRALEARSRILAEIADGARDAEGGVKPQEKYRSV